MRSLFFLLILALITSDADAQFSIFRRKEKPQATLPTGPEAASKETVFRPGDVFELRMSGMPFEHATPYAQQYTIGGDGFINIPLAGQVRAAGQNQSQLERAIEQKLMDEKIFNRPTAIINVPAQVRFVTVGGAVRAPNRVPWSPDLTLLSAIAQCGGLGEFARDRVTVIRAKQATVFSYKRLKRFPGEDPPLQPGDQVDVQG